MLKKKYQDLSGTVIGRDSAGRLTEIRHYINGVAHGRWIDLDSAGRISSMCLFDTASTTGVCVFYFPSGAKCRQGPVYRPGEAFCWIFVCTAPGTHRTFHEDGSVERLECIGDDSRTSREWYTNGQIASIWVDSAGFLFQKRWCPNGRLVGDLRYERGVDGTDPAMSGKLMLAHRRSGETYMLKARGGRFVLKSDWDGERIVLHDRKELNRLIDERDLKEVSCDPPYAPRLPTIRDRDDP